MTNVKEHKIYRNPKKKTADMVNTYRANRALKINGERRAPGELVPEAHTWLRVGNFEHTGYIKNERVPEDEFDRAVQEHCPDLADRLAELAKGAPVAEKEDTKFTGFVFDEDGQVVDVAARRRLERERQLANTAANDRPASFDNLGTPAHMDENSPDHLHSDGGPTLFNEKVDLEELLDSSAESVGTGADKDKDRARDESTAADREAEDQGLASNQSGTGVGGHSGEHSPRKSPGAKHN